MHGAQALNRIDNMHKTKLLKEVCYVLVVMIM